MHILIVLLTSKLHIVTGHEQLVHRVDFRLRCDPLASAVYYYGRYIYDEQILRVQIAASIFGDKRKVEPGMNGKFAILLDIAFERLHFRTEKITEARSKATQSLQKESINSRGP